MSDMILSYFGKVSTRADFVRLNASSAAFRSMDMWIQEGLRFLQGQRVDNLEQVYDDAGPSCFVFHQFNGAGPLMGAIRPSRDVSGRKYPFFVAVEMDQGLLSGVADATLPFKFSQLFDTATSLVDDAVAGKLSSAELDQLIPQHAADLSAFQANTSSQGFALSDLSFGDFCNRLWGSFQDSRKYASFKHLIDILLPARPNGQAVPGYGLQFPLLEGEYLAPSVSFWLDVCARLVGNSSHKLSLIWNTRTRDESGPLLYVNFSRAPASAIVHILQYPMDLDNIFRVDRVGSGNAAEMALSIPEQYGRLIETEDISLRQFLEALN